MDLSWLPTGNRWPRDAAGRTPARSPSGTRAMPCAPSTPRHIGSGLGRPAFYSPAAAAVVDFLFLPLAVW